MPLPRPSRPPQCAPPPHPTPPPHSLFGLQKAAQKLSVGYQQWAMNNDFKNDTQLLFASGALQALHARIEPEERRDYLLTFGPKRAEGGGEYEAGEPEHAAAHLGWRQYSLNCLAGAGRLGREGWAWGEGSVGETTQAPVVARAER